MASQTSTVRSGARDLNGAGKTAPGALGAAFASLGPFTWLVAGVLLLIAIVEAFIWPWQVATRFGHMNHTSPWAYGLELYLAWFGGIIWCARKVRERTARRIAANPTVEELRTSGRHRRER